MLSTKLQFVIVSSERVVNPFYSFFKSFQQTVFIKVCFNKILQYFCSKRKCKKNKCVELYNFVKLLLFCVNRFKTTKKRNKTFNNSYHKVLN